MQYITKAILIIAIIVSTFLLQPVSYKKLVLILLIISITLLATELKKLFRLIAIFLELLLVLYSYKNGLSSEVFCILIFDIVYSKKYFLIVIFFGLIILFLKPVLIINGFLGYTLSAMMGYGLIKYEERSNFYKIILDNERRMRYDLEITKNQLLLSNQEIEKLTEVKERNRIARDLHDNIGHSIASVLIQLQAGLKIMNKDFTKSGEIFEKCILNLQAALVTIRETVHNMYSKEKVGINYIHEIIDQFVFCKIETKFIGDFSDVSTKHMEVSAFVIKEALTNVVKHSQANLVELELTANSKFIRIMIKDNGKGCKLLVDGLGINSMKDRIRSINGIISMDSQKGLRIVCTIPTA